MLKKFTVIMTLLLAVAVLITGCQPKSALRPGATSKVAQEEEEEHWTNPEFNMDEVVDIGDEFQLDLTALAPISWSDNDKYSINPAAEVAEVSKNPNGGYDFTFTKFNQRIIFILDSSQRYRIMNGAVVEVTIDGEASSEDVDFRYHIGWSELGANWNNSNSPDAGPFSTIKEAELLLDPTRPDTVVNFMIQTRGGAIGDPFGDPVTVTIRSITFKVYDD